MVYLIFSIFQTQPNELLPDRKVPRCTSVPLNCHFIQSNFRDVSSPLNKASSGDTKEHNFLDMKKRNLSPQIASVTQQSRQRSSSHTGAPQVSAERENRVRSATGDLGERVCFRASSKETTHRAGASCNDVDFDFEDNLQRSVSPVNCASQQSTSPHNATPSSSQCPVSLQTCSSAVEMFALLRRLQQSTETLCGALFPLAPDQPFSEQQEDAQHLLRARKKTFKHLANVRHALAYTNQQF